MSFEKQKQEIIDFIEDTLAVNPDNAYNVICLIDLIKKLKPDCPTCSTCKYHTLDGEVAKCENLNNYDILNQNPYTDIPNWFGCIHHSELEGKN